MGFQQRNTSNMPIRSYDPIVGRSNGVIVRSSGIAYQPTKGYAMTEWEKQNWGQGGFSGGSGGGTIEIKIDISVAGVEGAVAKINKIIKNASKNLEKIAEPQCRSLHQNIRGSSPVKTGRYRASWMFAGGGGGGGYHAEITNDTYYAPYLVYGHHGRIYHDVRSIVNGWIPAFIASIVGAITSGL